MKRAYCSKDCQRADWSVKENGQRHVNWCRRHECGEEDVDWEIVPIPNKGIGIRAKKWIPAGFKIFVEPIYSSPNGHPGIVDLKPDGATLKEKFLTNRFEGRSGVALRIARTNHACRPNAATIYDDTALVAILFSQRDIQAGEEITICYYISFFGYEPYSCPLDSKFPETNSIEEELSFFRYLMSSLHGITCPSDCFFYDPAIPALVPEGRQIHSIMMKLENEKKIEEALAAGDKLVDIHRHLNVSWLIQVDGNYNLFRVAVMKSKTLPRAKEYIRSAAEVFRKICPYSEKLTKSAEKLLDHPETDPYYLRND